MDENFNNILSIIKITDLNDEYELASISNLINLSDKIDIETKDKDDWTLLHHAVECNRIKIVKLLLSRGANIEAKTKAQSTPLHLAIYDGRTEIVKLLLFHGANIEAKDINGWSPLHYAAHYNYYEIAELLLNKGVNVNAQDIEGWTPLHSIVPFCNNGDMIKLLLATRRSLLDGEVINGADINVKNIDGLSSLHLAATIGKLDTVRLLLTNGADKEARDNKGTRPIDLAKNDEIIKLLEEWQPPTEVKEPDL